MLKNSFLEHKNAPVTSGKNQENQFSDSFFQAQKERILIKGGIVVNDDEMIEADVFIESGLIK